jgi:hypothetical protein
VTTLANLFVNTDCVCGHPFDVHIVPGGECVFCVHDTCPEYEPEDVCGLCFHEGKTMPETVDEWRCPACGALYQDCDPED